MYIDATYMYNVEMHACICTVLGYEIKLKRFPFLSFFPPLTDTWIGYLC